MIVHNLEIDLYRTLNIFNKQDIRFDQIQSKMFTAKHIVDRNKDLTMVVLVDSFLTRNHIFFKSYISVESTN